MNDKFYNTKPDQLKIGQVFKVEGIDYILTEKIKTNGNLIQIPCKEQRSNLPTTLRYNTIYPYDIYVAKLNQNYF